MLNMTATYKAALQKADLYKINLLIMKQPCLDYSYVKVKVSSLEHGSTVFFTGNDLREMQSPNFELVYPNILTQERLLSIM